MASSTVHVVEGSKRSRMSRESVSRGVTKFLLWEGRTSTKCLLMRKWGGGCARGEGALIAAGRIVGGKRTGRGSLLYEE